MTTVVVFGAALGLALFVSGLAAAMRRDLSVRVEPYVDGAPGRFPVRRRRSRFGEAGRAFDDLMRSLGRPEGALGNRLADASFGGGRPEFRLEQVTWGAAATAGLWILLLASSVGFQPGAVAVLSLISFATGFLARDWWLGRQIRTQQARIEEELPVAIDLLTLSILAGESIPAAVLRISNALPRGIGAEFAKVAGDIRAGVPVDESLERLSARLPLPSIGRLVDALITALERGTPLADVLRAQADDSRESRRRRLLEIGGKREVLMLVPVVFLILPTVVVFALFPGLVSLDLLVP